MAWTTISTFSRRVYKSHRRTWCVSCGYTVKASRTPYMNSLSTRSCRRCVRMERQKWGLCPSFWLHLARPSSHLVRLQLFCGIGGLLFNNLFCIWQYLTIYSCILWHPRSHRVPSVRQFPSLSPWYACAYSPRVQECRSVPGSKARQFLGSDQPIRWMCLRCWGASEDHRRLDGCEKRRRGEVITSGASSSGETFKECSFGLCAWRDSVHQILSGGSLLFLLVWL